MKVFQIIGGEVTIINESICYMDTTENFKTDSGLTDLPEMVVYDNKQKCCVAKYPIGFCFPSIDTTKTKGLLRFPDNRLMQPYPFGLRISTTPSTF